MFTYHCPDCKTTNNVHEIGCEFEETNRAEFEKAAVDIISVLSVLTCSKSSVKANSDEWSPLHDAVFDRLRELGHIVEVDDSYYRVATKEERESPIRPHSDPLATIYEYGTVPGCHDNGLFALMAFLANQDLSWDKTKTILLNWYDRTNTWERGGFSEDNPEALIESKRHVWEEAYGWSKKARSAKRVIDAYRASPSADSRRSPSDQANA